MIEKILEMRDELRNMDILFCEGSLKIVRNGGEFFVANSVGLRNPKYDLFLKEYLHEFREHPFVYFGVGIFDLRSMLDLRSMNPVKEIKALIGHIKWTYQLYKRHSRETL